MIRLSKSYMIIVFSVVFGCRENVMTSDELRNYIREEENGLIKQVSGSAINTEVFYFPEQLLFSEGNEDLKTDRQRNIDYFMVKCETSLNNVLDDPSMVALIVNGDTVMTTDAISIPAPNAIDKHRYSVLVAFAHNLEGQENSGDVVLAVKIAGVYHYIPFADSDIEHVRKIKIIN